MTARQKSPHREPSLLRAGKAFHSEIRKFWALVEGAKFEHVRHDLEGKVGRIDVLVDDKSRTVSVVEVKRTDWDKMRSDRIRPNALRHSHQVWRYVEPYLDRERFEVCPGLIYRKRPRSTVRLLEIEAILNGHGIQVVWQDEEASDRRARARRAITRRGSLTK